MATLKNPSIYDDRGTIGSADELDAYGVWVKIEPEELSDADVDPFPDFDADFGPELSLDETAEESPAFEDFSYSDGGLDSNFDDLEALRQDIQSIPPAETTVGPAAAPASTDLSTQLLMKIADELSSIKQELFSLKEELSVIRSEKPRKNARESEAEEDGFFGEEDDGKIALTGDELNNIIHTADFTEETGADAGDFAPAELPAELPEPAASGDVIETFDGPPLEAAFPESGGNEDAFFEASDEPGPAAEADFDAAGEEILYDGLGRPLNRKISGDEDFGDFLGLKDSDDLKALRENGVAPMTVPPEDTSYLEEDPLAENLLAEGSLDLSDAVIEEPDLREGVKDAPLEEPFLEEPSLDNLPLIDLTNIENSGAPPESGEDKAEEKLFLEDITFEDLPDLENPVDFDNSQETEVQDSSRPAKAEETEAIDLSVFDDELPIEDGDLSFEVLDEDAELPAQENVQDNVITEDSFESISLDDDGDIDEVLADGDLEQTLPEDMRIELDSPSFEIDGLLGKAEPEDINFDLPAAANAGASVAVTEEVPPAIRMELKDVLVYMDKLLESLPEEKINEFAHSEHYNTYKKLFEELGISP
ncbi:MAG: hypothetical protein LBK63_01005 [Treponema sp.]|jgi:hypothetical protein|nr:hypothetical protein [Treponema sp.]